MIICLFPLLPYTVFVKWADLHTTKREKGSKYNQMQIIKFKLAFSNNRKLLKKKKKEKKEADKEEPPPAICATFIIVVDHVL